MMYNSGVGTTAVIGDVGGEFAQLVTCLSSLGVSATAWPEGLHVVQVGDLFGGTAHDVDVAHLVQPHLYAGRWTQLVGNWELSAVGGPEVSSKRGVSADQEALSMFSRWHGAGLVRYATTVVSASGRTAVVTHAGLTRSWLSKNVHGRLEDASVVVTAVNNASPAVLHFGGEMFQGSREHHGAAPSPVWASTAELWRSWVDTPTPWPQIHGHTTSRDWRRRRWTDWTPSQLAEHAHADDDRRRVRWQPAGHPHPIWGIDPGLWQRSPAGSLQPLVITGP
ncbi:MAG: hypothetical protein ABMA25_02535 [Ilumatobacteraceae bacterium]